MERLLMYYKLNVANVRKIIAGNSFFFFSICKYPLYRKMFVIKFMDIKDIYISLYAPYYLRRAVMRKSITFYSSLVKDRGCINSPNLL
jgi:hypothetical protein